MNLILFSADELSDDGLLTLTDRRFDHLQKVIKPQAGDRLRVGQIGGLKGSAELLEKQPRSMTLRPLLETPPPPKLELELAIALPRPKVLSRLLSQITSMGVRRVHIFHSYRVEKSFWASPHLAPQHIRHCLQHGLEQSEDTIFPEVVLHRYFKPFVEDHLPNLLVDHTAWVAHPDAHEKIELSNAVKHFLFIGPEGGFIDYEIAKLESLGVRCGHWGTRPLSVETATIALLALYI